MSRAILFCPKESTFVKRDVAMLKERYSEVDLVVFSPTGIVETLLEIIKHLFRIPFYLKKYDLVVNWFVGYHSIVPVVIARLYGIKTVAILGGTEGHYFPEYNYGNYRKAMYSWATQLTLRKSDFIFPVHGSLIYSEEDFVPLQFPKQGILSFNKKLDGHIEEIYCGFEKQRDWDIADKKTNSFLSVSTNLFGMDFVRKGIDTFVMLAKNFPNCSFTLVGNGYEGENLPNLTIISAVNYSDLIDIYIKHQYYVQLSIAEGFPNALAESMLYGCIPIGSSVFGIPDMIGDTGFVLLRKDKQKAIELIADILDLQQSEKSRLAKKASEKVNTEYTFAKRSEKFYKLINK